MGLSRQEVNLRRLLAKCELMLKSNQQDERFPKYLNSLEEMLREVIKSPVKPLEENLNDYKKKIYNIKVTLGVDEEKDKEFLLNETNQSKERDELLGLRQRTVAKEAGGLDDLEQVINMHQNLHEKIAEDMLQLTHNLKEQSKLANKIIKQDTEIVSRSAHLTDNNMTNLKGESEKLTEHSSKACKCWMWIMLMIVLVVFVNMVLFMKVMKKK